MNVRLGNQHGYLNVLLIPLILSVVLLLGALTFSAWAFTGRQDYKNNSDQKAESAVAVAVQQAKSEKDNEFLQREKQPLKNFTGPTTFGGVTFTYPKTWSAYSDEQQSKFILLMQPDVVSSSDKTAYALKVEVSQAQYSAVVSQLESDIKLGKLSASAIRLAKVPDVVGLRVDGQISPDKKGSTIYLPVRDKVIKISSEAPDKVADLNNIILPSFQFNP